MCDFIFISYPMNISMTCHITFSFSNMIFYFESDIWYSNFQQIVLFSFLSKEIVIVLISRFNNMMFWPGYFKVELSSR